MNMPVVLPQALSKVQASSASFDDGASDKAGTGDTALREARSTPTLGRTWNSVTGGFSALSIQSAAVKPASSTSLAERPSLPHQETDIEVLSKYAVSADVPDTSAVTIAARTSDAETAAETNMHAEQTLDDPLGVSNAVRQKETGRLDFAAFASQNAYNER